MRLPVQLDAALRKTHPPSAKKGLEVIVVVGFKFDGFRVYKA